MEHCKDRSFIYLSKKIFTDGQQETVVNYLSWSVGEFGVWRIPTLLIQHVDFSDNETLRMHSWDLFDLNLG